MMMHHTYGLRDALRREYSIAICLDKFFREITNRKIQIFASDISEKAIKKHAQIYTKADVE
jgi:chemotaxis methyl-accepting protein methylase